MAKKKKQGGKRLNAGRKSAFTEPTKRSAFVVRCQKLMSLNYMSMPNFWSGRKVAYNVPKLGAVAGFGAKICQLTTKADASHNVKLTTKTAIEPNACYRLFYLSNLK